MLTLEQLRVVFVFPEVNCVGLTCKGLEIQKECVLSFVYSYVDRYFIEQS